MFSWAVYAMVYLGSALMVYNIYGFIRFARSVQNSQDWNGDYRVLYVPIILLVFFLVGYLVVGVFGSPDFIVAGILFGGSIFVFIMYRTLWQVTERITEGERLKTELLSSERSNQAKTNFLASMSHELRTPMNVILGLDELALRDPDIPDVTRTQLEKIRLSGQHMLGLINNILEMNQIESGKLTLKSEEFSLLGSIDQVCALVQTMCDEKGLDFTTTAEEGIASVYVGDQMQLKQVLLCVLDNAVKYTDAPGEVAFRVCTEETTRNTQTVTFVISDTGVGMDESFVPKVFDLFAREDVSPTNRFGGSGLGLTVAKRTLDRMNATIEVASRKNEGTTFTIRVPLAVAPEPPKLSEPQGLPNPSLENKRILIVEDLDENAEIVADLLDLEGAVTDRAENGQRAVEMVRDEPPRHYDAILMDLRMPIMDGLEAARCIRAMNRPDTKTVPIIALTANAFESDVQQSLDAGMNAHLAKPVDVDLLYTTLKDLIQATEA